MLLSSLRPDWRADRLVREVWRGGEGGCKKCIEIRLEVLEVVLEVLEVARLIKIKRMH